MGGISDIKTHNGISRIERIIKTENRFLIAATGREGKGDAIKYCVDAAKAGVWEGLVCK